MNYPDSRASWERIDAPGSPISGAPQCSSPGNSAIRFGNSIAKHLDKLLKSTLVTAVNRVHI